MAVINFSIFICHLLLNSLLLLFFCHSEKASVYGAKATTNPYYFVETDALLPKPTGSASIKDPGRQELQISHRYGPCSPFGQDENSSPSTREIFLRDQLRVRGINAPKTLNKYPTGESNTHEENSIGGGNYVVTVGFGTPKRDLTLILDTGSDLTWIQCQPCSQCYIQEEQMFDPSNSSSYFNGSCNKSITDSNDYNIVYADDSYSNGQYACDTVTLSPSHDFPNFLFGCGRNNSKKFGKAAGMLGLGQSSISAIYQTDSTFGKVFSYCLPQRPDSTGRLLFGESAKALASPSLNFTRLIINDSKPFYYLHLIGISVNDEKLNVSSSFSTLYETIIDSGTVITRLPRSVYSALRSAFNKSTETCRARCRPRRNSEFRQTNSSFQFSNQSSISKMSTDSDDIDEDELLQIALKEQAQRDLNYQKPGSRQSKPVANFVQPPPPPHRQRETVSKNPNSSSLNQMQKNRRDGIEDDDDSEVEMLSISSGDEESSKDRGYGGKGRGGGGSGGRGGRSDSGGDRGWDGEEPDCWKHVDEDELARRVREMRETRTIPVVPKIERKASVLGRKGLNNLQSFPRGMECIDPLGLGIIDNKTLKLITESSESSPSKADRDNLDADLREKLIYFSDQFDGKLFLSRIHQDTSAADLEAGALALKTDLKGRTQQRKQLVKENFDCFVSCKTTIDDIESKLKRIEEDPEGSGTAHLFNCMQGVSSLANRAFEPLFERQAQAEKIRSVQGMLQRFRTLFNLPSAIRGSISKGEYDLAVREYRKAKSIALPSHVGILKRVLEEVEKIMHEFKGMLYKSMEDPQIDLTDLENTVRLLIELEPESDPVWHYLNIQNRRIRGLLEKCTLDHDARMETLHGEIRERALSDARWRQIQQDSNQSSDVNYSLTLENNNLLEHSQPVDLTVEEVDNLRGRYIRRLTAVLIHHVPAFWKVALSVFSGKFAKSSQVSADSNVNANANKSDEKVDGKYSSHSLDEVSAMIRSTISAYEVKVQNTFRDLEESNILRPYMRDAIKEISKACQAFETKESAPYIAVTALRVLHSEITKIYILRLCLWMRVSTEEISKDESWVPVSILERNKSPYTISFLPLAFRSIMASAMDQIYLMIQSLRSEATKSEEMFAQLQETQESVRLALLNCFLDFAGHLERIGNELLQTKSSKESLLLQNGHSNESLEELADLLPGSVVDPHQQLLIVLSNIGYCKEELSYELYNKYKHIWLQSREKEEEDSDIRDLVMSFSGLEEKVLQQYTFAKANLIRTAAASYLLDAGVQWGAAPAVKGVRDAAVELLHTLVAVHAEVFAGAKPLLDKTLGILVEGLIDTFLNLFHENNDQDLRSLDANGFCQLMLELEYFETILNPYFTADARESLKSLQGLLLEKATESVSDIVENPGHHRRPTRGSEDALDERQQGMTVSPDDLIVLAQQYSSELLQTELERTRINTACFVESIPLDSVPESARAAYASFRGPYDSPSRNYRGTQALGSQSISRHKRR